jgi:hypothetical protein
MNLEQITAIVEAFKSRVGTQTELLYNSPIIRGIIGERGINVSYSIFDGPDMKANKIASLYYEGNGELFHATLIIGWNEYSFVENSELCIELINRFVNVPKKEIL